METQGFWHWAELDACVGLAKDDPVRNRWMVESLLEYHHAFQQPDKG